MNPLVTACGDHAHVLLAVSGGGDSLGLMLLAAEAGGPRFSVATVDHALRPGSADVAAMVMAEASRLSLPTATLKWDGDKPTTGLQDAARQARYGLLLAHARRIGATAILTAHTADDQRETLLMRLLRGSGPAGLAAMAAETKLAPDMALIRPLLTMRRADLRALCLSRGLTPYDDPANGDGSFTRARLRALMPQLEQEGLTLARAARLAERMAKHNAAITSAAQALLASSPLEGGHDLTRWSAAPPAVVEAALAMLIAAHGDTDLPERLEAIENLAARLMEAANGRRAMAATLRGALIRLSAGGRLTLRRQPPRRRHTR